MDVHVTDVAVVDDSASGEGRQQLQHLQLPTAMIKLNKVRTTDMHTGTHSVVTTLSDSAEHRSRSRKRKTTSPQLKRLRESIQSTVKRTKKRRTRAPARYRLISSSSSSSSSTGSTGPGLGVAVGSAPAESECKYFISSTALYCLCEVLSARHMMCRVVSYVVSYSYLFICICIDIVGLRG